MKDVLFIIKTDNDVFNERHPERMLVHEISIPSCIDFDEKNYTRHTIKVKLPKRPVYEIYSEKRIDIKSEYIDVEWYWNKKNPINYKTYIEKGDNMVELIKKMIYSDCGIMYNGGVYGGVEKLNGEVYEKLGCLW